MLEVFRKVRWPDGVVCPLCSSMNVIRWGRYCSYQRYLCRGCGGTFNDGTGTSLHYSGWSFRSPLLFMVLTTLTHSSASLVAWLFGMAYMGCFKVFKRIPINIMDHRDRVRLRDEVELDEVYQKAGLKGRNNSSLVRSIRVLGTRG